MSLSYSPIRRKEEVIDCDRTEEKQPLGHFTPLMILCSAFLLPECLSWASAYNNLIYSDFKTYRSCVCVQVSFNLVHLCLPYISTVRLILSIKARWKCIHRCTWNPTHKTQKWWQSTNSKLVNIWASHNLVMLQCMLGADKHWTNQQHCSIWNYLFR